MKSVHEKCRNVLFPHEKIEIAVLKFYYDIIYNGHDDSFSADGFCFRV